MELTYLGVLEELADNLDLEVIRDHICNTLRCLRSIFIRDVEMDFDDYVELPMISKSKDKVKRLLQKTDKIEKILFLKDNLHNLRGNSPNASHGFEEFKANPLQILCSFQTEANAQTCGREIHIILGKTVDALLQYQKVNPNEFGRRSSPPIHHAGLLYIA